MQDKYSELLRDIVHAQGDPEQFSARDVVLTEPQLAIALAHFDHIMPEVVSDPVHQANILEAMAGAMPSGYDSLREYMGSTLLVVSRLRAEHAMKNDLECMANDMVMERQTDEVHA
jgi:hypothetical protein